MYEQCLGGVGLFCVACEISDDSIFAQICWASFPLPDVALIWVPKQPDREVYRVKIPDDLCTLHTLVEFERVKEKDIQRSGYND